MKYWNNINFLHIVRKIRENKCSTVHAHCRYSTNVKFTFPDSLCLRYSKCMFVIFMLLYKLYNFYFNGYMFLDVYQNSLKSSTTEHYSPTFQHPFQKECCKYKLLLTFEEPFSLDDSTLIKKNTDGQYLILNTTPNKHSSKLHVQWISPHWKT